MLKCQSSHDGAYGTIEAIPFHYPLVFPVATPSGTLLSLGFLDPSPLHIPFGSCSNVVIHYIVPKVATPDNVFYSITQMVTIVGVMTVVAMKMAVFARFNPPWIRSHSGWRWQYIRVATAADFHQDLGLGPLQRGIILKVVI